MARPRVRVDQRLLELGLEQSRSRARARILAGEVRLGDRVLDKPGTLIPADAKPSLRTGSAYVSRGGEKLAGALNELGLKPRGLRCVDVGAFPAGDSAFGCRQMAGNTWEWTASAFYPFPGYMVDYPYREYSAPWFGYRKVLKGGAWATRSRLVYNTYRNFFPPDRNDVLAGFRTCAR